MPPPDLPVKDVLKHLGIIKNELLIFVLLSCIVLNGVAYPLDYMQDPWQKHGGLALHLCSIPVVLLFGCFYCFALFKLPSSPQEMQFEDEAKRMLRQHQRRRTKHKKTYEPTEPEQPS